MNNVLPFTGNDDTVDFKKLSNAGACSKPNVCVIKGFSILFILS